MIIVPAPGRARQDCEFKAITGYIDPVSKTKGYRMVQHTQINKQYSM
jgi:hypothetical protein